MNLRSIYFIVIAGSLIGLTYNFINPDGIPLIKEERKLIIKSDSMEIVSDDKIIGDSRLNPKDEMKEAMAITLNQAYELYKENAIFIDARDLVEFEIGRIKNSVSLPYTEFDKYKSVLDTISFETPVVAYCDGKECDLSILLGDKLFEMGYKEVYIFYGGWVDWQMANYPIEYDE
ncbi:MAG: rhodanese-like domain-containing protein [Ignavibacteria bacterium]